MTHAIKNILFTTDLSENSAYAFRHAVSLAKMSGAALQVLHVTEPMSHEARITMQMFIQDETARKEALSNRVVQLKELLVERHRLFWEAIPEEDKATQSQVQSVQVIEGHPAEVILRRSKELKCDLIILGAHSHGFSHTFLGAVAKRVLRRATIPTLVVPYSPS